MQLIRKKKKSVLIYYLVPGINIIPGTEPEKIIIPGTTTNYRHYGILATMVTLYYGIIIFIMARGWFVVVVNIVIMAFALLPALLVSD